MSLKMEMEKYFSIRHRIYVATYKKVSNASHKVNLHHYELWGSRDESGVVTLFYSIKDSMDAIVKGVD